MVRKSLSTGSLALPGQRTPPVDFHLAQDKLGIVGHHATFVLCDPRGHLLVLHLANRRRHRGHVDEDVGFLGPGPAAAVSGSGRVLAVAITVANSTAVSVAATVAISIGFLVVFGTVVITTAFVLVFALDTAAVVVACIHSLGSRRSGKGHTLGRDTGAVDLLGHFFGRGQILLPGQRRAQHENDLFLLAVQPSQGAEVGIWLGRSLGLGLGTGLVVLVFAVAITAVSVASAALQLAALTRGLGIVVAGAVAVVVFQRDASLGAGSTGVVVVDDQIIGATVVMGVILLFLFLFLLPFLVVDEPSLRTRRHQFAARQTGFAGQLALKRICHLTPRQRVAQGGGCVDVMGARGVRYDFETGHLLVGGKVIGIR